MLVCRECNWWVCGQCNPRRYPRLEEDPLFYGPSSPCLLTPRGPPVPSESCGTVIVCPGGNYEFRVPQEAFPAAQLFAHEGIRTLVLNYRLLPKHGLSDMVQDLRAAIKSIRSKYTGPVAALGFSAGGHLIASYTVHEDTPRRKLETLDAQVLVYPCIDGKDWADEENCDFSRFNYDLCCSTAHSLLSTREALLGGKGFDAPPTFLVASTADEATPPKEHANKYVRALRKKGIVHAYMCQDFGLHGFGVDEGWTGPCMAWLKDRGFGKSSTAYG